MKKSPSKTILCGTDFSENAASASLAAAALARISGKNLALLHVAELEDPAGFHPSARRRLQEATVRLANPGVSVKGELLQGPSAGQAILDQVDQRPEADLIVVSSVSKTAFDRWTLGSVSESLAEAAAVTTLVVRRSDVFVDWAAGNRLLKILVAADFSTGARAALRWASGLRKLGPCQVTAAYVNWPPADRERLGIRGPMDLTANPAEIQHVIERDFREMVAGEMPGADFGIIVQPGWGRVDAHLVGIAIETGADLLVVGSRRRAGLARWTTGSVSRGILRHAPMNVACVPAIAQTAPVIRRCRRVLAAVDLHKHDSLALPAAYSIVGEEGAVFLLNVESAKPGSARKMSQALASLEKVVPAESCGIRTEVLVVDGADVAQAICTAAETHNADIVCVGAHTRPGVAARIMGSVALAVLQKCRRPVLVVWPED